MRLAEEAHGAGHGDVRVPRAVAVSSASSTPPICVSHCANQASEVDSCSRRS
jgi:hypothetical protein